MRFLKSWRAPRAALAAASGLAIAAASLTLAAPAAQADTATISAPNTAWVSQSVNVQVSNISSATGGSVSLYSNGSLVGNQMVGALDLNVVLTFSFMTPNTPPANGLQVYAELPDGSTTATKTITVQPVPTVTVISAPNTAKVGTPVEIDVTVTSQSPSQYSPAGNVVVTDANGAQITSMSLTPGSKNGPVPGQAYAYWRWTPPNVGTFYFIARYVPASGTYATASTSAQDALNATPSGGTISLKAPATLTQGVPVTLTATVAPATVQGTVGFTLNGAPISGAIPIVNGNANFTWTPSVAGQVTLGASYTTNQGGSGSTTDVVTISGAPAQSDSITLVQPGWGPWAPNGTYTLGNGSNFAFQTSTLSGAPVTLSETGPCQVSGLTINVPTGSGVCNLQASTPGGNGYAPVTYGYTVNLIPGVQVANIAAPPSGRFKVGRVLVLESPGQADTNAGQNIGWKVQKKGGGRKHCKLLYPDNGSVTLRIVSKGSCTVIGSAPGVAGQWQPFKTARNYTGR